MVAKPPGDPGGFFTFTIVGCSTSFYCLVLQLCLPLSNMISDSWMVRVG
jgi:hypothetical protein